MSAPQRPGPPQPWQPHQPPYGPGQTEWIPRVQDQPRRDEPFLFEEAPPEPEAKPAAVWAMRIAGLVAVALISGFLYALLQGDSGGSPGGETPGGGDSNAQDDVPAGRFEFTPHPGMPEPQVDTDCVANSRGKVQDFFEDNPCVRLTRALYTSRPPGQDKEILTWVAVVEMDSPEKSSELHKIAQASNSGNVTDPLIAGIVQLEGVGEYGLGTGGYDSQISGNSVIIVESDWLPSGDRTKKQDDFLVEVSADALRYGQHVVDQG